MMCSMYGLGWCLQFTKNGHLRIQAICPKEDGCAGDFLRCQWADFRNEDDH